MSIPFYSCSVLFVESYCVTWARLLLSVPFSTLTGTEVTGFARLIFPLFWWPWKQISRYWSCFCVLSCFEMSSEVQDGLKPFMQLRITGISHDASKMLVLISGHFWCSTRSWNYLASLFLLSLPEQDGAMTTSWCNLSSAVAFFFSLSFMCECLPRHSVVMIWMYLTVSAYYCWILCLKRGGVLPILCIYRLGKY